MAEAFISWSGQEARTIAERIRPLFKKVLPNPTLFVASEDLKAGDVWFTKIAERLDACDVGIIVVTPQNKDRPWLHFEAGAIAKRVGQSAVVPLLCGVPVGDLANTPLAQLQSKKLDKEGLLDICFMLSERLELGLPEPEIAENFEVWWEKLGPEITDPNVLAGALAPHKQPTTSDLSVQITQLSSLITQVIDRMDRSVAPAILGQGELATLSLEDVARYLEPANRNALAHHYTHKPIINSLAREAMTNALKRRVLTVAPTPEPAQPAGSDEDSEV